MFVNVAAAGDDFRFDFLRGIVDGGIWPENASFSDKVDPVTGRPVPYFMPGTQVYALDTFQGMPPTDRAIDAHSGGDFSDVDLEEIRAFLVRNSINNVHLAQGLFEETAQRIASAHGPFTLAHIDCDIYSAVACVEEYGTVFVNVLFRVTFLSVIFQTFEPETVSEIWACM